MKTLTEFVVPNEGPCESNYECMCCSQMLCGKNIRKDLQSKKKEWAESLNVKMHNCICSDTPDSIDDCEQADRIVEKIINIITEAI